MLEQAPLTDEEALKRFLQDIQCLDRLEEWSGKFNLFDVLKISGTEIRHSNVLAWLLDPEGSHGLGDAFLRRLVQKLTTQLDGSAAFRLLLMDLHSCTVLRESEHTDLLVLSHREKFLLCIENKVFSGEHDDQLHTYHEKLTELYPGYDRLFVYLTPDGALPASDADCDEWQSLSYPQILEMLRAILQSRTLAPEISFFIQQYIDAVRRNIVGDPKLEKICQEIYAQHKTALDLIYNNRMDAAQECAQILQDWCRQKAAEGLLLFDPNKCSKSYIRFTTPTMTGLLPELAEPVSGWKTTSMYYYEIVNHGDFINLVLTVCSDNLSEEHLRRCVVLGDFLRRPLRDHWRWKRLFTTTRHNLQESPQTDALREELFQAMDAYWKKLLDFEKKCLSCPGL